MKKLLFPALLFAVLLASCKKDKPGNDLEPQPEEETVTDTDGNKYATVKIGSQTWMKENLRTARYNDGTPIQNVTGNADWVALTEGAYSYYNNDPANNAAYGKLYNYYAVSTGKLCPQGWHIPTEQEWSALRNHLGTEAAGGKMKTTGNKEDGTGLWLKPNTGATNESGFSGLPGGERSGAGATIDGTFNKIGTSSSWWTATSYSATQAHNRMLGASISSMGSNIVSKKVGLSCRCVKDLMPM